MDDLTRCLYEFVCEKRLGGLSVDQEYQEVLQGIELQRARVEAYLNQEQQRELTLLIGNVSSQGSIEGEHLFQAALLLARELSGLVRGVTAYARTRSFSFTPSRAGAMTINSAPLPMPWTRVPRNWGTKAAMVPAMAQPARA